MSLSGHARLCTDLHPPLSAHEAQVESSRCYFCHDAPCVTACPTGIDIPLFIRQIATSNPKGAAKTIFDENIFGGMCARVCPTETLCEEACVRNTAEERPVRIGELQRHATDTLMRTGTQPFSRAAASGKRVAVVGAGPAGLSCAHRLAVHGHAVVVYDAHPKPGGLNEYGIAAYKTIDDFAQAEVEYIVSIGGIEIEHGKALGADLSLDALKAEFDAVFLGVGLGASNTLEIDGAELDGVDDAIEFIARLRQTDDLSSLDIPRRLVVIGGGMTAIDAAVQSSMLGAEEVSIAYRRERADMNASVFEQELAQTSGVMIRTGLSPRRIIGENGRVSAMEFDRVRSDKGAMVLTGERVVLPCDGILRAIGQRFVPWQEDAALELAGGRLKVDEERRTTDASVWAGGDCAATGEDLTVAAVQDGKLAAESMHRVLTS